MNYQHESSEPTRETQTVERQSSPETGTFQYDPLPANDPRMLRVLDILPGKKTDPLVCTLKLESSLPDDNREAKSTPSSPATFEPATYEALSYVWGDPTRSRQIILNGCAFGVTQNLEAALRHLRREDVERRLWVDAICINQADSREKEREVARMCSIYFNCRQVVVWLGEGSTDSDVAMEFANEIYRCFSEHPMFGRFDEDSDVEDDENFYEWMQTNTRLALVQGLIAPKYIHSWKSLHQLFSRAWWSRAWVLQEITVARQATVFCGTISRPWSVISMAASVASDTFYIVHQLINGESLTSEAPYAWKASHCDVVAQIIAKRERWTQQDQRNIHTRLNHTVVRQRAGNSSMWLTANIMRGCSLPQDKIFSVIGLLPDALRDAIRPNYRDPVDKIFKDVVKAYIDVTRWLNIICHSQYTPWRPVGYPSWMPDWTRIPRMIVYADRSQAGFNFYDPADSVKACVTFSEDLSVLSVEGFAVGTVKKTLLEFTCLPNLVKLRGIIPERDDNQIEAEKFHSPGVRKRWVIRPGREEPSDPVVWEFDKDFEELFRLTSENYSNIEMLDKLDLFLRAFQQRYIALQSKQASTVPGSVSKDQRAESDTSSIYTVVQGLLMSRTFFEMEEGQIGIAPDFTKRGDLVCVFKGCDAPIILREHTEGSYTFIGDSHVLGFMDGEGMKGLNGGKYTLQRFPIS
ncbi:HET-domain-containing protein [Glonium stellatum]|uniref:HET-domain-containing protein n=1 Tax=Glonium stellatum TaxID=574774 RepID=A0A8E2F5X3_9PEZI|nr:HET-domain-containing protein [Glonium stellatum]